MASNIGKQELKQLASQFVRQYYTLLNKAPHYIPNFYNNDSTFLHGAIEMASQHETEPAVGRDQIETKMNELKFNDCRAKIEQIDCLKTLAGGLVIQVIGELSNNGRPMRRFLQTFVLAPQTDQVARKVGDRTSNSESGDGSQANQKPKFFVLNNIFRYQDEGPDNEFEDNSISVQVNASTEIDASTDQNPNNDEQGVINDVKQQQKQLQPQKMQQSQQQIPLLHQQNQPSAAPNSRHQIQQSQVSYNSQQSTPNASSMPTDPAPKQQQQSQSIKSTFPPSSTDPGSLDNKSTEPSQRKGASNLTISGGSNNADRRTDVPETVTEKTKPPTVAEVNGVEAKKNVPSSQPVPATASTSTLASVNGTSAIAQTPTARPNELKTWANVISRNAHPTPTQTPSAAVQLNAQKGASADQQNTSSQATQSQQNQIPHHHHSPPQHNQDQTTNNQQQQSNQLPPQHNQQMDHNPRGLNNNNNHNMRRRNMIRKTSSKLPGNRPMKDRPRPPPPASKPVA